METCQRWPCGGCQGSGHAYDKKDDISWVAIISIKVILKRLRCHIEDALLLPLEELR